jgi:hypothetical protein
MTSQTATFLVALPFAARRGARPCRVGAVVALAAWALLWGYFVTGIAAPAGRLTELRAPVPLAAASAGADGALAARR